MNERDKKRDKEHGSGLMFRSILLATAFVLLLLMHEYTGVTLVHPIISIVGFFICFCFFLMGRITHYEIRRNNEEAEK
jgi:uncharacterized membrane protein